MQQLEYKLFKTFNEMLLCTILMINLHHTTCRYDNNAKQKPSYRSINAFSQWANICWMLGLSQGSDRRMGAEEVCKTKLSFFTVYRLNTSHNLTADHLAVWWRHLWLFYIHTYKHTFSILFMLSAMIVLYSYI